MKLSNGLLIGFVGFILVYMIVAFTELRLKGDHEDLQSENAISERFPLGNFSYLRISELGRRVSVSASTSPRIEIKSMKGGLLSSLQYRITEDSVILNGIEAEGIRYEVHIYVPEMSFDQIDVYKTNIQIENFNLQEIFLKQTDSNVNLAPDVDISKIVVDASENSNLTSRDARIDTVSINFQSSNIYLYNQISRIEGYLSNSSRVILYGSGEINIKKDASSSISWMEAN